jgi:uncharacterized protein YcbX
MTDAILSEITIYPVKSCAGIALSTVALDRFGPAGDRRWLVVDASGDFLSQRQLAAMALVATRWTAGELYLGSGESGLRIPVPGPSATRRPVQIWGETVAADDAGDEAAAWLSRALAVACRLVYMADETVRPVDTDYAAADETVSFADGFPLLLISQASLDDLNTRLAQPVPMNRFRPNLVVSGCEAYAEDRWQRIRIGAVEFDCAKPCSRCVMPSIDQASGQRDTRINRVLASYRRVDGKVYFGQNLLYQNPGRLQLGATVEVLS